MIVIGLKAMVIPIVLRNVRMNVSATATQTTQQQQHHQQDINVLLIKIGVLDSTCVQTVLQQLVVLGGSLIINVILNTKIVQMQG